MTEKLILLAAFKMLQIKGVCRLFVSHPMFKQSDIWLSLLEHTPKITHIAIGKHGLSGLLDSMEIELSQSEADKACLPQLQHLSLRHVNFSHTGCEASRLVETLTSREKLKGKLASLEIKACTRLSREYSKALEGCAHMVKWQGPNRSKEAPGHIEKEEGCYDSGSDNKDTPDRYYDSSDCYSD